MSTPLTPTQEQVLAQLSAGITQTAAAAAAGIHRNTIGYWVRSSQNFREAHQQATYEKALYWREQAETLAAAALEAIRTLLTDPKTPATVRLRAAQSILDKAMTPPPPMPETMHKNAQKPDLTPVESIEPKSTTEPQHSSAPSVSSAPSASSPKIGRNAQCPCGSGKKFKRCCGAPTEPTRILN